MKPTANPLGAVNLSQEIEFRRALSAEFELFMKNLDGGSLRVTTHEDLNALALLLLETIEARKSAEREESRLKSEMRKYFQTPVGVLDLRDVVIFKDTRTRKDLDKEALTRDFGSEALEPYFKSSTYDTLTVKRKGG